MFVNGVLMREELTWWSALRVFSLMDALGRDVENGKLYVTEIVKELTTLTKPKNKHLKMVNDFLRYHGYVKKSEEEPTVTIEEVKARLMQLGSFFAAELGGITRMQVLKNITADDVEPLYTEIMRTKHDNASLAGIASTDPSALSDIFKKRDMKSIRKLNEIKQKIEASREKKEEKYESLMDSLLAH